MISLLPHEELFFKKVDNILQGLQEHQDIHVSGGWVRDKLMNKESLDIDLVMHEQLVENFCNHLETMLKDNIVVMSEQEYAEFQQNPKKLKEDEKLNFLNKDVHIITQKPLDGIKFYCLICEYRKDQQTLVFKVDVRQYFNDTLESDSKVRDFTVNALYYSLRNRKVVDIVGVSQKGMSRFKRQIIKSC